RRSVDASEGLPGTRHALLPHGLIPARRICEDLRPHHLAAKRRGLTLPHHVYRAVLKMTKQPGTLLHRFHGEPDELGHHPLMGLRQRRRRVGAFVRKLVDRFRDLLQDRKSTRLNSSHEWISYAV